MPRFSMHSSWDNLGTKTFQCVRLSVIYSNLFEFSWLSPFCKHWIHPKNCPGRRDNSDNSCFCFIHAGRLHCQCPASQWKQSQKPSHSCNLLRVTRPKAPAAIKRPSTASWRKRTCQAMRSMKHKWQWLIDSECSSQCSLTHLFQLVRIQ